ncbi:MAG: hypothetical protein CM15mP51_20270 [Porticoccaceae bacterium]|nr:MAG: hypothetical protein CM15mP51_20270 [Porticoccaceae bacterium]
MPPNGQELRFANLKLNGIVGDFQNESESAEYVHLFTEVKKLVYEDRAKYYADMDFNDIPIKDLVSKKICERRPI